MKAGRLDREIEVLKRTVTRDSFGAGVETFSVDRKVWAEKLPWRGGEQQASDDSATFGRDEVIFRIRWYAIFAGMDRDANAVTYDMRIRHDGFEYDIVRIVEIGRRVGLDIYARATVK